LRGFFAAGASSLVASLWALNDRLAAKMMAQLYEMWYTNGLKSPSDLPATLRSIQCQTKNEQPHPVYWAPFILAGQS